MEARLIVQDVLVNGSQMEESSLAGFSKQCELDRSTERMSED